MSVSLSTSRVPTGHRIPAQSNALGPKSTALGPKSIALGPKSIALGSPIHPNLAF